MFYSIIHHRKSKGVKPADFHSHPWLEITWTIIPAIILVLMAIPATKVLLNLNNNDKDDLTIKITGYQWKWHYDYLEDGIQFFSNLSTPYTQMKNQEPKSPEYLREVDNPLVVPVHKKIRFLITSNDVNHAWWVPDLAIKRDAIGGIINEAWTVIDKPGVYRGQCAELCGINHAFMPIVVVALSEQGYQDWVANKKGLATSGDAEIAKAWTMQELMDRGQKVYNSVCAACHQPNGAGLPPTFPALKGSKIATGPVADHVNIVVNGKGGTAMQAFKNQLSDVELASVITYERNAFGNATNTMVQPIQLKALRDGKSLEEALAVQPSATSAASQADTQAAQQPDSEKASAAPAEEPTKPAEQEKETVSAEPEKVSISPEDALKEAMVRGEKVYLRTCVACHQPTGMGMPPTFPALKGSALATGPVSLHIDRVMNGKQGTTMLAFKDQLTDQDLADVITYERNAWGNNTGTLVSADQIKAARQQDQSTK
jgi:cytochrome c oxidase subunit 2